MSDHLLIVGAGIYAVLAAEIAVDISCFDEIAFVADEKIETPTGAKVIGTTRDLEKLSAQYSSIVVAIGNPTVRLNLLKKIKEEMTFRVVSLMSLRVYISPTVEIGQECIIEPVAVVHTGCVISEGCIISAGAVVNHASRCCAGVHVDCNATVDGYCVVPSGLKIRSGSVFRGEDSSASENGIQDISKRRPKEIGGLEYTFESGI